MALLTLTLAGCHKEDTHIDVNKSQVLGTWVKVGTQEYWRYQSGGSGATWDESEDIGGDETNLTFSWTLDGDYLEHSFSGRHGNQNVTEAYYITEISETTMKWRDANYDGTYTLRKVSETR